MLFFAAFPCVGLLHGIEGFGNHCEHASHCHPEPERVPSAVEIGRLLGREILGRGEHIGGVQEYYGAEIEIIADGAGLIVDHGVQTRCPVGETVAIVGICYGGFDVGGHFCEPVDRVRVKPHIPVADLEKYKLLQRRAEYLFAKGVDGGEFYQFHVVVV